MFNTYKKVVERYIECLNQADLDGIRSLYADEACLEDPVGSKVIEGIDAITTFYQEGVLQANVKVKLSGEVCGVGREVAFPFEVITNANGDSTKISIIDVFRFDEHTKIESMRAFWGPDNFRKL